MADNPDLPRRATAAQMASRDARRKQQMRAPGAKGPEKRRFQMDKGADAVPNNTGGGLFGGSIQAPGAGFQFAAPEGLPTLPNPSFFIPTKKDINQFEAYLGDPNAKTLEDMEEKRPEGDEKRTASGALWGQEIYKKHNAQKNGQSYTPDSDQEEAGFAPIPQEILQQVQNVQQLQFQVPTSSLGQNNVVAAQPVIFGQSQAGQAQPFLFGQPQPQNRFQPQVSQPEAQSLSQQPATSMAQQGTPSLFQQPQPNMFAFGPHQTMPQSPFQHTVTSQSQEQAVQHQQPAPQSLFQPQAASYPQEHVAYQQQTFQNQFQQVGANYHQGNASTRQQPFSNSFQNLAASHPQEYVAHQQQMFQNQLQQVEANNYQKSAPNPFQQLAQSQQSATPQQAAFPNLFGQVAQSQQPAAPQQTPSQNPFQLNGASQSQSPAAPQQPAISNFFQNLAASQPQQHAEVKQHSFFPPPSQGLPTSKPELFPNNSTATPPTSRPQDQAAQEQKSFFPNSFQPRATNQPEQQGEQEQHSFFPKPSQETTAGKPDLFLNRSQLPSATSQPLTSGASQPNIFSSQPQTLNAASLQSSSPNKQALSQGQGISANQFTGFASPQKMTAGGPQPSTNARDTLKNQSHLKELTKVTEIKDAGIDPHVPAGFNETQRHQYYAAYRLRALNRAMEQIFSTMHVTLDPLPVLESYAKTRQSILETCRISLQRKINPTENKENENPSKIARFDFSSFSIPQPDVASPPLATASITNPTPRASASITGPAPAATASPSALATPGFQFSPSKRQRDDGEDQENQDRTKRTRSSDDTNSQAKVNGGFQLNKEQSLQPTPSPQKGRKRGADTELTQDTEPSALGGALRDNLKQNISTVAAESNTSNKLRNILGSPKKILPMKAAAPQVAPAETPRANPFASILQQPSAAKSAPNATNMFMPKASASTPSVTASATPAPSNLFVSKATTSTPAASTSTSTNVFSIKGASATQAGSGGQNALLGLASFKPTHSTSGAAVIKPPVFGSAPVNFLAQFGKKATQNAEENEAELLQKAKDEDMDSDDDEAEWEANWKANRAEEKKQLNEASKSKKAKFVPGKGFVYESSNASDSSDNAASATTKPADKQTSNSVFNSLNPSRASTPGLFGSTSGSVVGGSSLGPHAGRNIFGHLSDVGSGNDDANSEGSDDDSDEVDEDSENVDPSYKPGQELPSGPGTPVEETGYGIASAKKANLFSMTAENTVSGANTPAKNMGGLWDRIPHDEKGKPIKMASTEEKENTQPEPNAATSIFSRLGANTPAKDNIQEKPKTPISFGQDNTQQIPKIPMSFGEAMLNASSSGLFCAKPPTDQTWKQDSPIRFGQAGTNTNSAPSINFTAATPTKEQTVPSFSTTPGMQPADSKSGTSTPSLFAGFNKTQPASGTSSPSLFSGLNKWQPLSSNLFGDNSPKPTSGASTTSIFAGLNQSQPAGLFGSSTPGATSGDATPSLFANLNKPAAPFAGLFGSSNNSNTPSGTLAPSYTFGNASSTTALAPAGVGFNFGGNSTASSLLPSAAASGVTSRATTPGGTTDGESGHDDPDAEKHEQIDLTAGGPGEENEDTIHKVRAKVRKHVPKGNNDVNEDWTSLGIVVLRVLEHKETGAARVIARLDPSGKLILNKALLPNIKYEPTDKTVKLMAATDEGAGLETYLIQVKTQEMAAELAAVMEKSKVVEG